MRALALLIPLALAACVAPAPGAAPASWRLVAIDGMPFTARATLTIDSAASRAYGNGPCNSWSGDTLVIPAPGWRLRNLTATEMACADLAAEQVFFTALQRMTRLGPGPGRLDLTDQKGRTMTFVPLTP